MVSKGLDMITDHQKELLKRAVDLLGGGDAVAAELGISRRNVYRLIAGQRRLHAVHLEKLSKALIAHADACRRLERELCPAYSSNLTPDQARPPLHAGKHAPRAPDLDEATRIEHLPDDFTVAMED